MKLNYYPETDTLYIDFRDEPAAQTEEIAYNVLVDYNAQRQIVGLTIDGASEQIDLAAVELNELPNVQVRARSTVPVSSPAS